jgi:thiol:disulfide interchange protein DsbD
MTRLFLSLLVTLISSIAIAQPNPVSWTFSAKKTGDKTFQIEMKAQVQPGWHIYSQSQSEDAIALPTEISFNNNPLLVLKGKPKEQGKLEKITDKTLGVTASQYSGVVSFIQEVELKAKVKTAITGAVEYQTCDDEKCLPPKKIPFTISLR